MPELDDPLEQLRVIRSLMERATVYRSISAPTALIGGLLSLGGFALAYHVKHHLHTALTNGQFRVVWLVILALTALSNFLFLWRGAVQRQEPFLSAGMKSALMSLVPPFLLAGVLTFVIHRAFELCLMWILLYGLGLLATQNFAPRSIKLLGSTFLLVGIVLAIGWKHLVLPHGQTEPSTLVASGIMAGVFGGIHLAYAALVWALGEERRGPTSS